MKIITADALGNFVNEEPIRWASPGESLHAVLEAPVLGLRATATIYGRMTEAEPWRKFKGPVQLDKWVGGVPAVPFYRVHVESFSPDPRLPGQAITLDLDGRLKA